MRSLETLIVVARSAAVMAAVFGSVVAAAYAGLEIWDVTHPPVIPGWTAAPGHSLQRGATTHA